MCAESPTLAAVITQAAAVRAKVATASCRDCSTLSRFLGKAMLLLEALLADDEVALPQEITDDFSEAILAASDAVTAVGCMSRLQAFVKADDTREMLKAACADLRAAVESLASAGGCAAALPLDSREDLALMQRQLASLRMTCRPKAAAVGADLLHALALRSAGISSPDLAATLHAALHLVELAHESPGVWLDAELRALAVAAAEARLGAEPDIFDEFHFRGLALALVGWAAGALPGEGPLGCGPPMPEQIEPCGGLCERWRAIVSRGAGGSGGRGGSSSPHAENQPTTAACPACAWGLTPATLEVLEKCCSCCGFAPLADENPSSSTTNSNSTADGEFLLTPAGCPALCAALNAPFDVTQQAWSPTRARAASLRQYQAAAVLSCAAEAGLVPELIAAGAAPALLRTLDCSRHAVVRAAAATALRTLCRDSGAREAFAAAGCIRPLARHLQSPTAGPRRAAARALGNVVVAGEASKKEAVEKYGIPQSLIAMLRAADDVLGQEAAAAALANLAANSEAVQNALGRTEVFPALTEVLGSAMTPGAQQAAARALRNLCSRVHVNKLRATPAVPALLAMLRSPDPAARAAAATALAAVCEGNEAAAAAAVAGDAGEELVEMLNDAAHPACRDAAACALAHLLTGHHPHHHHTESSSSSRSSCSSPGADSPFSGVSSSSPSSAVISTEAAPQLVALLGSGTPSGRRAAAKLLAYLAKRKSGERGALLAANAVPRLAALLLPGKQEAVARASAAALTSLMHRCDPARRQLLDSGGVGPLVSLLCDAHEEATRKEAARALGALCANNNCHQGQAAAACGAISALSASLARAKSASMQQAAAAALANLACLPANQAQLLEVGTADLLLQLLHADAAPGCRAAAARGLSNLVADGVPSELRRSLSDMILLLADLALGEDSGHGGEEARVAAAGALGNLACTDPESAAAVVSLGGPAALAKMCCSTSPSVREAGALALREVCSGSNKARRAAIEEGVVPSLAQMLVGGVESAKEAAAECLGMLASVPEAAQQAERHGAIVALKRLEKEGIGAVAAAAKAALRALSPLTLTIDDGEVQQQRQTTGQLLREPSRRSSEVAFVF